MSSTAPHGTSGVRTYATQKFVSNIVV